MGMWYSLLHCSWDDEDGDDDVVDDDDNNNRPFVCPTPQIGWVFFTTNSHTEN